jgi:hypothetical protein
MLSLVIYLNFLTFVLHAVLRRVEQAYLALARSLTEFFSTASAAEKALCQGEVYRSERGIPMWRTGYEQCGEMR